MAQPGSPSPIANLLARRANVQRARDALGLSQNLPQGAMRSGKPISANEPASPTPANPAQAVPPTPAPPAGGAGAAPPAEGLHPDNVPNMSSRDEMLAYTKRVLEQAGNQGRAVAPVPAVENAPGYTVPSLQDQLSEVGAQQQSPYIQFMRLAGRTPSSREMAMFSAANFLSQQLGRNPTKNELMMYMQGAGNGAGQAGPSPIITGTEQAGQP